MEDYRFTTEHPLPTNADTMAAFLDDHFHNRFDNDAKIIQVDNSYAEVEKGNRELWACHASGDGDFSNHRIRFELIS